MVTLTAAPPRLAAAPDAAGTAEAAADAEACGSLLHPATTAKTPAANTQPANACFMKFPCGPTSPDL
ncbi:MAG: hypothetical protein ABI433_03630 [Burkholderiaceae bacterium]